MKPPINNGNCVYTLYVWSMLKFLKCLTVETKQIKFTVSFLFFHLSYEFASKIFQV